MKQLISRILVVMLLVVCFCSQTIVATAETVSKNPLVDPKEVETAKTPQRYTNILLLGIEFGFDGYRGSAATAKGSLQNSHTDSIMVASINMTTDEVNLISLPRDTLTYVPGVHGIYKLNAAFNCANTVEEGFERIRDAASWLLGGIQIDHYCAVDMGAMVALGDFIGGVDLDVEMTYSSAGRHYKKGMQHLDGRGMMDYIRARQNATVNANDIGRTGRNRQMMIAIFQKLKSNASLVKRSWDYATSGEINFFTDMSLANVLNLLNKVQGADTIGSHVLTGTYRTALQEWNFTFTDQANRIAVIKDVYGIDVEKLPYVEFNYTKWLMDEGMTTVRTIAIARDVLAKAQQQEMFSAEQEAALNKMNTLLAETIDAFDTAADSMAYADQSKMVTKRRELRAAGDELSLLFNGVEVQWYSGKYWYADPLINEYHQIIWQ